MNGARLTIECLKANGASRVFGYPGGAIMPIYDALYDSDLAHTLARNEQGAGFMAQGWARSSHETGICFATSGPGGTNIITALGDALADSVPMIAITGNVPSSLIGTDAFQECDMFGLSLSCTKHSFLVTKVEDIPQVIAEAFYIAQSGRPGPVLIDIPKDVQLAPYHAKCIVKEKQAIKPLDKESLFKARDLLKHSKRPLLYVGGGVKLANAQEQLREFIDQTNIPAFCTLKALGSLDPDHKYYLGLAGMHGKKAANIALNDADLLIVLGARFDDRITGKLDSFAPEAKIIHCDIDLAEINKLRKADVGICADLKEFLPALQMQIDIKKWQDYITHLRQINDFRYEKYDAHEDIKPLNLLHALSLLKSKDSIIVTDVGQHQMWTALHVRHYSATNFLSSAGFGTMGFGLPAAIGAKMKNPQKEVILITGDGSIMMNIQELNTLKRENIAIKILLLDNERLGMVAQWQRVFFQNRLSQTILDDNPDFITLASAFNIKGMCVSHSSQLKEAFEIFFNSDESFLLQVKIGSEENVWPLVPPNARNIDMLEG